MPGREARRLLAKVGLLVASLVVSLGVVELLLAIVGYEYSPLDIQVREDNDARAYHLFQDDHFTHDPALIWRPRAGHAIFNAQGFRGPELERPKPAGTVRIVTVGDSNTLGWAGEDGANWPAELQALLDASGEPRRFEVANAGVWGYSSHQGRRRFEEAMAYEPDLVLVSFGANDAHLVAVPDAEFADSALRRAWWGRVTAELRVAQLLLSVADARSGGTSLEPRHRVPLDEYRSNLEAMVALGRERDAVVVLLTRPYTGDIFDDRWWKLYGAEYNLATVEVAEATQAPVIDVYSYFKTRDELFGDESHFTREGHRVAAEIIYRELLPSIRAVGGVSPQP